MTEIESFLNILIANHRKSVKLYVIWATSVLGVGMIIITAVFFYSADSITGPLKAMIGIGGGFISSISAFPIKEIINRMEKIGVFKSAIPLLKGAHEDKIEEFIWKTIGK